MQTVKGKEARGLTAAEWRARVLAPIITKMKNLKRKYPKYYRKGLHISFDNARYHSPGQLLNGKRFVVRRLPLAPRSPDIHKVPEHAINTLKSAANKYFYDHPEFKKMEDILPEFEQLFFRVVTAEAVRKDVASLRATYNHIRKSVRAGGVAGGVPPKSLRCAIVVMCGVPCTPTARRIGAHPPPPPARLCWRVSPGRSVCGASCDAVHARPPANAGRRQATALASCSVRHKGSDSQSEALGTLPFACGSVH